MAMNQGRADGPTGAETFKHCNRHMDEAGLNTGESAMRANTK